MAAERRVIDIEDVEDVLRLIDDVRDNQAAHVIRRAGEEVAVIAPLPSPRHPRRALTDDELEEIRSVAGSWRDHLDGDAFLTEIYAARDEDRADVEL